MDKSEKIKIILGIFYLLLVSSLLCFFLIKFSFQEITSYEFIKDNRNYFFNLKERNLALLVSIFFIGTIMWVFLAGFLSPLALIAGFVFGKWFGTALLLISGTIGATFLYIFGNYFLKDFIKNKFLNKFQNLESKFKKSEFIYLILYRFIGGIPFPVSNLLPSIFNVKVKNFFYATLIGLTPQLFIAVSIGSGLEKIIDKNVVAPSFLDLIFSPEIYIPLILFFILAIITLILRKLFYRTKN